MISISETNVPGHLHRFQTVQTAASRTSDIITIDELRDLGVPAATTQRWCREQLLSRLGNGVYRTVPGSLDFDAVIDFGSKIMGHQQAFGDATAVELWDLPGGSRSRPIIIGPPNSFRRSPFVVSRRVKDLRPVDFSAVGGHRTTTPLRSILDAARTTPLSVIGEQLSAGVARELFTYQDAAMRTAELGRRGKPGLSKVRTALRFRLDDAELLSNSYERRVLVIIRRGRFPEPVAQFRIVVNGSTYFLDFAWPEYGVFLECDSMLAHSTPEQLQADLARQNDLVGTGLIPIRCTYQDAFYSPARIDRHLAQHLPRTR